MAGKKTFSDYISMLIDCEHVLGKKLGKELETLYNKWKADVVGNIGIHSRLYDKIKEEQKTINTALGTRDIVKSMGGALFEELVKESLKIALGDLQQFGLSIYDRQKIKVWEGIVPAGGGKFEKEDYKAEFDVLVGKAVDDGIAPVVAISCKSVTVSSDFQAEALRFSLLKQVYPKVPCLLVAREFSVNKKLRYIIGRYLDEVFVLKDNKHELEKFIERVKDGVREFVV